MKLVTFPEFPDLERESKLVDCIVKIIDYLRGTIMTASILTAAENSSFLTGILFRTDVPVVITSVETPGVQIEGIARSDLVVVIRNYENISSVFSGISWHSQTKFIIFPDKTEIEDRFSEFWQFRAKNVFALTENPEGIRMYGFQPFSGGNCGAGRAILLGRWVNGEFSGGLSRVKSGAILRNLNNCVINVSVVNVVPEVIYPDKIITECRFPGILDGIEVRLMDTISKTLNFDAVYSTPEDDGTWGRVVPPEGVIGEVFLGKRDFGFGFLAPLDERARYLDLTHPFQGEECVTFAVPNEISIRKAKWLKNFTDEFGPIQWTLIIISSIFIMVASKLITSKNISDIILLVLSSCLGHSVKLPRKLNYIFIVWFWFSFIVVSMYEAIMSSRITIPLKDPTIETLDQLFESDLLLTGYASVLRLITIKYEAFMLRSPNRFETTKYEVREAVDNMTRTKKMAHIRHLGTWLHVMSTYPKAYENITPLKDCVHTFPPVFVLRKHSPLTAPVNRVLFRIIESGLMYHWKALLLRDVEPSGTEFDALTLNQCKDLFQLHLVGLTLGVVVFFFEILYHKLHRKQHKKLKGARSKLHYIN